MSDFRFQRFRQAYMAMAKRAKYRPAAPGDGCGGIYLSKDELSKPPRRCPASVLLYQAPGAAFLSASPARYEPHRIMLIARSVSLSKRLRLQSHRTFRSSPSCWTE